jgi:hypothetical protein
MLEIEIITFAGIGSFRIRIGRTFLFLMLTFVSNSHFHV